MTDSLTAALDEMIADANAFLALPVEQRQHPLAHQGGIAALGLMLSVAHLRMRVECACGWKGYRGGGPFLAGDKPCPKCGASVVLHAIKHREEA